MSSARSIISFARVETATEWLIHGFSFPNYLRDLGVTAQSGIHQVSSVDLALRDAFRKAGAFLMTVEGLTEDEAISLLTVGCDFGVTQVVDGNWGFHRVIRKELFSGAEA